MTVDLDESKKKQQTPKLTFASSSLRYISRGHGPLSVRRIRRKSYIHEKGDSVSTILFTSLARGSCQCCGKVAPHRREFFTQSLYNVLHMWVLITAAPYMYSQGQSLGPASARSSLYSGRCSNVCLIFSIRERGRFYEERVQGKCTTLRGNATGTLHAVVSQHDVSDTLVLTEKNIPL